MPGSSIPPEELEQLTADIVAALKTVYDPEIPADIYELGLIYKIDVDDDRNVAVEMTLTAPGCPVAGEMPDWVENAVASVPASARCRSSSPSTRPGTGAACPTRRACSRYVLTRRPPLPPSRNSCKRISGTQSRRLPGPGSELALRPG